MPRRASAATMSGWARSAASASCHSSSVAFGCTPGRWVNAVTSSLVSETVAV